MPTESTTPSGWYFYNHSSQPVLAIVGEMNYFSVRVLLDHDPAGEWSELAGFHTWEDALEFALEETAPR